MDDPGVAGGSGGPQGLRQGRAKAQKGLGAEFITIKVTLSRHKKKKCYGIKAIYSETEVKDFF